MVGGCKGELKSIFKEKVKAKVTKEMVSDKTFFSLFFCSTSLIQQEGRHSRHIDKAK